MAQLWRFRPYGARLQSCPVRKISQVPQTDTSLQHRYLDGRWSAAVVIVDDHSQRRAAAVSGTRLQVDRNAASTE